MTYLETQTKPISGRVVWSKFVMLRLGKLSWWHVFNKKLGLVLVLDCIILNYKAFVKYEKDLRKKKKVESKCVRPTK